MFDVIFYKDKKGNSPVRKYIENLSEKQQNKEREAEVQLEAAKLELAEHLVEYREKKDMTQRQLAERLGIRQQVVAKIENGSNITLETLIKFLNVLGIVLKVEAVRRKRSEQ